MATTKIASKRDYMFALAAGLLIGILLLPILRAGKPELYSKYQHIILPLFLFGTPIGLRIAEEIAKKIPPIWQVAKFGVIGVLNTVVDLGVLTFAQYVLLNNFSIKSDKVLASLLIVVITIYSIIKAFSFVVANVSSFFWNKYWTFAGNMKKKSSEEFIQFFAVSIVGFIINVTIASFAFKHAFQASGLTENQLGLIGGAFGSVAGLAWNFIGYKFWVFKK